MRRIALGLALGLGVLTGPATWAEATPPPCRTTAGDEGLLFAETHAMIFSPVAFDEVRRTAKDIQVFSDIREGQGVLAYLGKATADSMVEFVAGGAVVHQCVARIVDFDPKFHDLTQLQSGDCDLKVVAGRSELLAGHSQVVEVLQDIAEVSIASPRLVQLSMLTSRRIYLLGQAPGLTVLASLTEGVSGEFKVNLCPIRAVGIETVLAAGGPTDSDLCQDAEGAPMRLAVGQTARMVFRDAAGNAMEYSEAAVASPKVVGFSFDDRKSAVLTGTAPGWTTLTLLTQNAELATSCEVIVE